MQYEGELYAERLRREAQVAALEAGDAEWTAELDPVVRVKLQVAWRECTRFGSSISTALTSTIKKRTIRSLGRTIEPKDIEAGGYR